MNDDLRLTDQLLHDMFERRARRGSSDGLRWAILGATRGTAQRRSRLRVLAGGRPPLRLLAVAALLAGTVGAGLLVAGGRQPPPPAQHFADFAVPFDFRPVEGVPTTTPIFGEGIVAFTMGGPSTQAPPDGGAPAGDAYPLSDSGQPLPGTHGIVIAHPSTGANGAYVHDCPAGGVRVPIRLDPDGFVDDLQVVAGVAIRQRERTTFDGRPAVVADLDPSRYGCDYADFHTAGAAGGLSTGTVALKVPSRLIVTDVGGQTIALQAWAATPEELEAWLPTATRFLSGVHFTGSDLTP